MASKELPVIETSSPEVWRRWLALELVRLRKEAGLDQRAVAKALRCTVAKVSYYETAVRPVVVRDLDEVLLPLYGVPEDRWPAYLQAARASRQKGWWEKHGETELPSWFSLYVGLEQGATQIRTYESELVPGLLQTRAYAAEVIARGFAERSEEESERIIEVRLSRQAVLVREPEPLRFWAVLDEAVLRREVGGRETVRAQLLHIAEVARRSKVTVQVMPFAQGAHPGMAGPFSIMTFPTPTDPGLVYIQHRSGSLYLEEPKQIETHAVAFAHLCAQALSPADSIKLVRGIAEEF